MSQFKKKKANQKQQDKITTGEVAIGNQKGKRTRLVLSVVIAAIMLAIIGTAYYINYVAPFRRTILTVDNIAIKMDYFLKRTQQAGSNPLSMLDRLTKEQLIKLEAPQYGIEVTPEDIDRELRRLAGGQSENISESEFKEWYRQQLNETRLSNSEYRDTIAINVAAAGLQSYLGERMPTIAEQIHLYTILVATNDEAEKVRARWAAGEQFTDLARELSLDSASREKGGDVGWWPRGLLRWDYILFDLKPGEVSEPIPNIASSSQEEASEETYNLFMVAEKADAREIDDNFLQLLRGNALDSWFPQIYSRHTVEYKFNSEIEAWLNWQLAKMTQSGRG